MKGFVRSNTFKVMVILIVLLVGLMAISRATNNTTLQSLFGFFLTPMQEVASVDTSEYENYSKEELAVLYAQLVEENVELRNQLVDYYEIKQENEQYEGALNMQEQNPQLDLIVALVIGKDPLDVSYNFSINKGYLDGVEKGDPVVSEQGIVGVVSQVYSTSSYITTIFSEDIGIGAISNEFSEIGVVEGDMTLLDEGYVRMSYLTKDTQIKEGTIISTSGTTGLFPADFLIGRVKYIANSAEDASVYAAIEPFEDIKNISSVYIVTNFSGKNDIILEQGQDDTLQQSQDGENESEQSQG